ncbi:MAG: hypothetical protein NZM37_01305 [Sandaracinaceae bacterium]|nr:hypothetical protein [Sandaracinaceae bacterium]MDW8245744.1 hypothetical protein [Sandaracinaceae bacterium]
MRRAVPEFILFSLFLAFPQAALGEEETGEAQRGPSFWERVRLEAASRPPSTQIITSAMSSLGFGHEIMWGAGFDVRLEHYPTGLPWKTGAFIQSELLTDGSVRIAGGFRNGFWLFGCQVGLAYRFEGDRTVSSLGLQLGKTIDFGPFSLGGRVVFPLLEQQAAGPQDPALPLRSPGFEGAIVLSIGFPTLLEGELRGFRCLKHSHRNPQEQPN